MKITSFISSSPLTNAPHRYIEYIHIGIIVSGIGEFKIDCIGKNNNGQSFTLVMKEVPECIAKSCDVSNWEAEKGNLIDSREVEEAISASMTDADCTFNSAGKVTGVLVFAVTSFAAAALMFF
jgi:hypothetical protein